MTTASGRKLLQGELARQGFAVTLNRWPKRATYYKPDGEAMPGLPADPEHMQRYMARGFTLTPPGTAPKASPPVVSVGTSGPGAPPIAEAEPREKKPRRRYVRKPRSSASPA